LSDGGVKDLILLKSLKPLIKFPKNISIVQEKREEEADSL
jgi:hypothetical protein